MRIQAVFPSLPISDYPTTTVWRCIGVTNPDAEALSSGAARDDSEIIRIHNQIVRATMLTDETRRKMNWATPSSETRYSDGNTPVVYTATFPETAVTERFFWAYNGVSKPTGVDLCIRLEVFEVEFSGNIKDLVAECPPCNGLVHPDDYDCCQDVGELAYKTPDLDALLVRSARKIDGVNVPIFRDTKVGRVTRIEGVTVFISDASKEAHFAGTTFDPSDVDVYSSL